MAEQRSIAYKSLGFTLGLGGKSVGAAASKAASSSFLDTLLSTVPSAKALLPTLIPDLSKSKPAKEDAPAGQRNEGLPFAAVERSADATGQPAQSPATSPKQNIAAPEAKAQQKKDEPQDGFAEPKQAVEVISLLSDSESERRASAIPPPAQAAVTSLEAAGDGSKGTNAKPISAEFIPLRETAPVKTTGKSTSAKAAAPGSADALADEEEIRRLGQRPYWMSYVSRIDSPLLRLHQELVELCELVQPTPEEATARRSAVAAVAEVVQSIWPQARCEVFGSYATGLYVPTSDIDLVILDSGCTNVQAGLKALATSLSKRQMAQNIQVVGKARVPIVKFETVEYGNLAFDLSFDVANGPQAAVLVSEMTAAWPMMRPLILCLKLFLQQRELNEVYTGGIGSYALITLVAAFLQLHASRRPKTGSGGTGSRQPAALPVYGTHGDAALPSHSGCVEPGLGTLLVDFLRFYGRVVNIPDVGVSCAGGGRFFRKVDKQSPSDVRASFRGWLNEDRMFLLAVEDPKDPDNDVCRNSFNIMRVKTAFEYAYQMLTAPSRRDESLLARILRLGPILASRPRPGVPHLRELGYYSEPPGRENHEKLGRDQPSERKQQQQQQESLAGQNGKRSRRRGSGGGANSGEGGVAKGNGRKRSRDNLATEGGDSKGQPDGGGPGKGGDGPGSGSKRTRTEKGAATAGKAKQREEQKKELKEQRRQRRQATRQRKPERGGGAGSTAGVAEGGSGGGGKGEGRPQKRRREENTAEATAPAAAGTGAGGATPARSAKRARVDGRQQKKSSPQGGSRPPGNGSRSSQQQQPQQERHHHQGQHSHHQQQQQQNHHYQQQQSLPRPLQQQQPQQERRAALMHLSVQQQLPAATAAVPAPTFHPGYAPPPSYQSHRQHHRSGGGGSGQRNHSHHAHHSHHSHHSHHHSHQDHHHSHDRQSGGYHGGDVRGGGYGGSGGGQGSYGRGPPPPMQHQEPGAGRVRAPIMARQQQHQSQLRGQQHSHYGQRTHVFFD